MKMEMKGGEAPAIVADGTVLHGEEYGAWGEGTAWRFYLREGMAWDNLAFRLPEGKGAGDMGKVELQKWKLVKRGKKGAGLVRVEENDWRFAAPAFEWTGLASEKVSAGLAGVELLLLGLSWASARRKREERWKDLWPSSALVALALAALTQVVLPVQSWLANRSAYPIGCGELAVAAAMRFSGTWLLAATGLWLLSGCFGRRAQGMVLAFATCLYLEAGILSAGLPELNGDWSFLLDRTRALWDAGVWGGVFALASLSHPLAKRHYGTAALCLLALEGASVLDVQREEKADASKLIVDDFCTVEEVVRSVEWSREKNVLVFIVDSLEREQAAAIMADAKAGPSLREQFRGFVAYANNVGAWDKSLHAVPNLLTGGNPESVAGLADYYASMYSDRSVLKDLLEAGFAVYLDTEALGYGFTNRRKGTWNKEGGEGVFRRMPEDGLGWTLEDIVRFRCCPFGGKGQVAFLTGVGLPGRTRWDDEKLLANVLKKARVSEVEHGVFAMFHTRGVHHPVEWDRNGERTARPDDSDGGCIEGGIWVMRQLGALFDELRAKGIYDGAFIAVLADHGNHGHEHNGENGLPGNGRPFLWVKAPGSRHAFSTDGSPAWHGNVAELLRRSCREDLSEKAIRGMLVSRRRAYRQMEEGTGKINEWVVGEDGTVSMSESFLAAGNVDSPLATGKR
ncbi:MAG: hypothetical protein J6Y19_09720, partial [Kiritimatiellae bacterium]|nr:hypothetical protein [Kiritimatiellia bacterium]